MLISSKSAQKSAKNPPIGFCFLNIWRISKKLAYDITIRELIKWLSRKLYEVKRFHDTPSAWRCKIVSHNFHTKNI